METNHLTISVWACWIAHCPNVQMDDVGPGHVNLKSIVARRKGAITVRPTHFLNQIVQIRRCANAVAAMAFVAANAALGSSSGGEDGRIDQVTHLVVHREVSKFLSLRTGEHIFVPTKRCHHERLLWQSCASCACHGLALYPERIEYVFCSRDK
jgi:hypothetical protein